MYAISQYYGTKFLIYKVVKATEKTVTVTNDSWRSRPTRMTRTKVLAFFETEEAAQKAIDRAEDKCGQRYDDAKEEMRKASARMRDIKEEWSDMIREEGTQDAV